MPALLECLLLLLLLVLPSQARLVHVTALTRHGSRAPDKVLAKVSCAPLLQPATQNGSLKGVFRDDFGTLPGELTAFGESQMEDVGKFIRERYRAFADPDEYSLHTTSWEFIAREGSRQQRSMMAIVHGLFPNRVSVPIKVTNRVTDAVLGGPAPSCTYKTADMIVKWHETLGKAMVLERYEDVKPFEKLCNVSLKDNPVNARPGGPNPHAWIGDVSDLLDSIYENMPPSSYPNIERKDYLALTDLAFQLEQHSHFDDPRGAAMFAGEFPNALISSMEQAEAEIKGKEAKLKTVPKMRLYACSRELEYGASHLFGWESVIRLKDEPVGRVRPGSTFLFELWENNGSFYVEAFLYQPGAPTLYPIQKRTLLADFRKAYEDAIAESGDWKKICGERLVIPDQSSSDVLGGAGRRNWTFWVLAVGVVAFGLYFLTSRRRGYSQL